MKNLNTTIYGTETTSVAGRIIYLRTMLCGEVLREFDELTSKKYGTTATHLKFIQEGLLGHPPPDQCTFQVEVRDTPRNT